MAEGFIKPLDSTAIVAHWGALAEIFRLAAEPDSALAYHRKVLDFHNRQTNRNRRLIGVDYMDIAHDYIDKKDFNAALVALDSVLATDLKAAKGIHHDTRNAYRLKGDCYLRKGEDGQARYFYEQALKANNYDGCSIEKINDLEEAFYAFSGIGNIALKNRQLEEVLKRSVQADSALQLQRRRVISQEARGRLSEIAVPMNENAIEAAYELWNKTHHPGYLQKAFYFSESSKGLALYDAMQTAEVLHFGSIDDSLVMKEANLRYEIAAIEKRIWEIEGNEDQPGIFEKIEDSRSQLFELRQAYADLEILIQKKYKEYAQAKFGQEMISTGGVQQDLLEDDQAMLEYFAGDRSIFVFLIKKDGIRLEKIPIDFPLAGLVKDFRSGACDYYLNALSTDQYAPLMEKYQQAAFQLYKQLVASFEDELPQRVIVIPDGMLAYLPFEALLTQPAIPGETNAFKLDFWVEKHDVSYCYSATLLREMRNRKHKNSADVPFLGMAPDFAGKGTAFRSSPSDLSKKSGHAALDFNKEEVNAIHAILGGTKYLGRDATLVRFKQEASSASIIHLSTHGEADDHCGEHSYLAFFENPDGKLSQSWLQVREIYNLQLNAKLVTLSACKTMVGELRRGEGLIGLSRAFSYAGAKSIVATLWSVNDFNTKFLMENFYTNLKTMPKDQALSQAQRTFLDKNEAHPFFWAGFVLVGDMRLVWD